MCSCCVSDLVTTAKTFREKLKETIIRSLLDYGNEVIGGLEAWSLRRCWQESTGCESTDRLAVVGTEQSRRDEHPEQQNCHRLRATKITGK